MLRTLYRPMLAPEGDGGGTTPPAAPANNPSGKVWTDEYVQGLREEAKQHRLTAKGYLTTLRKVLGLPEDAEVDDAKIAAFQAGQKQKIDEALARGNARLIAAEIKGLNGYDPKLVERLIDKSKLTIDDAGTVKGLTEQLAELEKDFPAIKVAPPQGATPPAQGTPPAVPPQGGNNPPVVPVVPEQQRLEADLIEAQKAHNLPLQISIKNKLFELASKK